MDIESLQRQLARFSKDRDWDQFHSNKNLSMALSVEASELLEIFQWLSEDESNSILEGHEKFQAVKEELADIFIYLLKLCDKMDIDLEQTVREKIGKNERKYPVEKAKGSAKKYSEL